MKKVVALLGMLFLAGAAFGADTISPRLSLTFPGTHSVDISGTKDLDTEMAGAFGVEYLHSFNDQFAVGGGAQYTFDTKIKDMTSAFNFLPVYLTGTYTPPIQGLGSFAPYVKANVGYDVLFSGNDDYKGNADLGGGLYWAAGIGTKFLRDFSADVLYSSYMGNVDNNNVSGDVTYSAVSLNLGYAFSL